MSVRNPIRERLHPAPFARLHAVADALDSLVAYADTTCRIRFANRPFQQWFGREPGELDGSYLPDLFAVGSERARQSADRALAGQTVRFELRQSKGVDGERDLEVCFVPDTAGGKVHGFTAVIEDVTERRRAEEGLRDAARRRDEFLATLAHELRNPLAPIRNAVEVLALAEADRGVTATARAMIERQLKQLVRLIDDLLDVSRITRGRLELHRERVDLATVLQLALETSRPLLETRQHGVHVIWPHAPLHVDGDPSRLAQVFANLLNNSAKYSEPGGEITIAAMREGNLAVVKVADVGAGIPQELLPRVFDLYARPVRAHAGGYDGLGLGLTLVKRLVELHGGTVEAESEGAGKGSVFSVRLPLAEAAACEALPASVDEREGEPGESRGTRVLVVDDNHDAATSLALMLDLSGYEICTASDGVEALAAAESFHPEIVVLDIGMPRLDGYQTARAIRARPWGQSVKLLALTGWGQDEDRQRAFAAGFDHHLTKPVDPLALQKLLESLPRASA